MHLDVSHLNWCICMCRRSPGQECCYNAQGNLVVGSPGGGSVNSVVPVDFPSLYDHIEKDLIPYLYCCPWSCGRYYEWRPSDDGTNYEPPLPGNIYQWNIYLPRIL